MRYLFIFISLYLNGQSFPNLITFSTGQGLPGTYDSKWKVNTQWLTTAPTNTLSLNYTKAYINNNYLNGIPKNILGGVDLQITN